MCNVNCRKKGWGIWCLVLYENWGVHRMEMKIKTCITSPNPNTEKTTNEKKCSRALANSSAILFVVKIWERILFSNGEKFMFFLFFREPTKIL